MTARRLPNGWLSGGKRSRVRKQIIIFFKNAARIEIILIFAANFWK